MDPVPLVENKLDDGQRLLDRLGEEGVIVRAACWVKPFEEDRWSLYIATPSVDEKGTLEAYRQVNPVLRSLGDDWITSSDVTLVGEKHPLVQDARDILRRFPHRGPIRSPRSLLWGISVEEVYVYPLGKVEVTIYGLVFRGDPVGALHLSFEPHNPHSKLTVGSRGERKEYPAQTGIDWVVAAPEGAKLERNTNGQRVLVWELHGNRMESSANEVWSLANLGLHGFRFLHEPA
ncbi:MAG: hypothetical protein HYS12_28685 [Planctomycetes bacterium]|nr:hypothetical protein [Planctomycetota bacterium]